MIGNSAQYRPVKCAKCGGGTFTVETRGPLGQDRLNPNHFSMIQPVQFTVCSACRHAVDPEELKAQMKAAAAAAEAPGIVTP